ncbi:MAG TPA: hypothetical protein VFS43_28170 [Polyangiaceae bacterium]|nr:hypothetical protein [Polyangiaceae bacterium]
MRFRDHLRAEHEALTLLQRVVLSRGGAGCFTIAPAFAMTEVIRDEVRFEGRTWVLLAMSGEPRFEPARFGLALWPGGRTADVRGFALEYEVRGGGVYVERLLANSHEPPPVNGVAAAAVAGETFSHGYDALGLAWPLSGTFLLGAGVIAKARRFRPFLSYASLAELVFEQGRLVEATDCSALAAPLREASEAIAFDVKADLAVAVAERWRAIGQRAGAEAEAFLRRVEALEQVDYTRF